jgi:serine/threonine-protein kinase
MALDSEIDGRADIYSLGCVAYWLLTGSFVFEADNPMALAAKHLREEPAPPSKRTGIEIPTDLEEVVLDCLRKNPVDRPSSAEELANRLSDCAVVAWTNQDSHRWWQLRFADGNSV